MYVTWSLALIKDYTEASRSTSLPECSALALPQEGIPAMETLKENGEGYKIVTLQIQPLIVIDSEKGREYRSLLVRRISKALTGMCRAFSIVDCAFLSTAANDSLRCIYLVIEPG